MVVGTVIPLVGLSYLEEDNDNDQLLVNEFMDAHGLLHELADEIAKLLDPKVTHIGVGFAFNKQVVKVVEFLSIKPLMIN
jgi:hypothetical protein